MKELYLDNAATTKPVDSVLESIKPYIVDEWHNPSSIYEKGVNVKKAIDFVRYSIADILNCDRREVYFTSGAAESNNWVIRGFIDQCKSDHYKPVIITTSIEHKSILSCLENIAMFENDLKYDLLTVDKHGCIYMNQLEQLLSFYDKDINNRILVSIGMANSEIGTIHNIKAISDLVHKFVTVFHVDATQVFGHMHIDVDYYDIDLLTASGQKLGGLKGTGLLYKRKCIDIKPLIYGTQEKGMRGGTENVVGIIALGEAIRNIDYRYEEEKLSKLRDYMISRLKNKFGCRLNGSEIYRLSNNINVIFPQNITGESLIYMLEIEGIYISSGSACDSNSEKPSRVLKEIGLSDEEASRTIRITLSKDITKEQIEFFINRLNKAIELITYNNS